MVRQNWAQEDDVDSAALNDLYRDSIPAYDTEAARTEDWFQPITNLRAPQEQAAPPLEGQQSTITAGGPDDAAYDVWNGAAWVPWRRVAAFETGLIQVVVTDISVEEGITGNVDARFQIYLVDAEATLANYTDPARRIQPRDLAGREIRVNYRAEEYDPLTPAQRVQQGIPAGTNLFAEAIAGSDFDDTVVGTLVWRDTDAQIEKVVDVPVFANPEDENLERFQLGLSNFRGVRPLKPVGICAITDRDLPLLRVQDVTISTTRISIENPNIAARIINIPITLSQAAETAVNLTYTTFDITAVGTGTDRDYVATSGALTIPAGQTTASVSVRIPTQLLEATEVFGFRVTAADPDTNPTAIFLKPEATITIQGRALKPTYYPLLAEYGPETTNGTPSTYTMTIRCIPAPFLTPIVVAWATDDQIGASDNQSTWAQSGWHYISASGTITFGRGETTKQISIQSGAWNYRWSLDEDDPLIRQASQVDLRVNFTLQSGDGEPATDTGTIVLEGSQVGTLVPGQNLITIGPDVEVIEGERAIIPFSLATSPLPGVVPSIQIQTRARTAIEGTHYRNLSRNKRWPSQTTRLSDSAIVQTLRSNVPPDERTVDVVFSNPRNCALSGGANIISRRITIVDTTSTAVILTGHNQSIEEPPPGERRPVTLAFNLGGAPIIGTRYTISVAPQTATATAGVHYVRPTGPTGGRTDMVFIPTDEDRNPTYNYVLQIIGGANITRPVFFNVYVGATFRGGIQTPAGITLANNSYRVTITPRRDTGEGRPSLPAVDVSDVSVLETAGLVNLQLRLTGDAPANCQVNYQTADGTARAGTDYTSRRGTATFAAGGRRATIQVPILANTASTADKRFQVRLSGYQNCVAGNSSAINVTVENTDAVRPPPPPEQPPDVRISDASLEVPSSGTANGTFTISTSRVLAADITGTISTTNGTARAGTHFTALTNQPWRLRAGTSTVNVPVVIRSATLTSNLTFNATIALTSTNANLADGTARFTITSTAEPTSIRVQDLTLTDAGTTSASVVILRSGNLQPVTLRVRTVDGTALAGVRYRRISNRLVSFRQGQVSATVPLTLIRPTGRVPRAQFTLRAGSLSVGTLAKGDGTITLPAYEPVIRTLPYIDMSSGIQTEPAAGGTVDMIFTISASKVWTAPITGRFRTSNISARAGSDYTAVDTTWRIPVGQRTTTVRVPILADTQNEANETFRVTITLTSVNDARFRNQREALTVTGTIRNRQQALVTLSVGDITVGNRGETVQIPIRRTGPTTQAVTFQANTYSTGSATPGQDYTDTTVRSGIILAGSSASASVRIPTLLRGGQPRETFGVRIHSPGAGVTIADDRGIVTLPPTSPSVIVLPTPIIAVRFTSDTFSSYATLSVNYPVILSAPQDGAVTGSYRTTLVGSYQAPRFLNDPNPPTRLRFNQQRSGAWTIRPGQTSTVVPVLTYRHRTGDASWITAVAASLVLGLGSFGIGVAGALGGLASASVAGTTSVAIGSLPGTITVGTSLVTITATTVTGGLGVATTFSTLGVALVGGVTAAGAVLGGASIIAIGNQQLSGDDLNQLLSAFAVSRIQASATVSRVSGATSRPALVTNTILER